jgi:putative peptide zinc metalloprotease protein
MIYFGFPGFFVDTTDIWMEGKRARLAVSWAGPYSGLILAGMASIAIAVWPGSALNGILFRFAFLTYLLVFLNLNPLLKLDGYYLLMDWLEIPMLREKSLAFLRTGLPAKLRQLGRESKGKVAVQRWLRGLRGFSREEWIFTLFGVLSALWTLYAVYLGISFWQSRLAAAVGDLFAAQASGLDYLLTVLVILLSAAFLLLMVSYPLRLLVGVLRGAAQRGVFASTWLLAALMLTLAAILALVSFLAPSTVAGVVLSLAALLASLFLAGRNALSYAGSRFVPVSALLGLAALAWLADGFLSLIQEGTFSPSAGWVLANSLHLLALLALCAAAFTLLVGAGFRQLWTGIWVFAVLALVTGAGVALHLRGNLVDAVEMERLALLGQVLLPALGLGLLAPSLLAFLRTASGPAWAALVLAFGWLVVAGLLDLSRVPVYLLLACTLALHNLALSQVRFRSERPRATIDLDDMRRLRRSFAWIMEGILGQVREIAGERQARRMAESFTHYARASQWPIGLAPGQGSLLEQVTDATPETSGLIERGETYAAALSLLLDLVTNALGKRLTRRTLQGAYDDLPWEEREIAGQYLFVHVDQARALSREFEAVHRDYAMLVSRVPVFATMSEEEIGMLLARLKLERHHAGKRIIRQGDRGDRFHIVRRGHVEVTQRDAAGATRVVNQLDRGAYFGEVALLRDAPRNATCRATVPTETLTLSREDFDRLARHRFAVRGKLNRSLARAELLRRLPLFSELDGLQIQQVAARLQEEHLAEGTVFIRQGVVGDTFYLIENGRARVSVMENGQERVIAERGPGEHVGEIALLLEVPRTASVTALTPIDLLTLCRQDFDRLVQAELRVGQRLERETSRRMSDLARAASVDM